MLGRIRPGMSLALMCFELIFQTYSSAVLVYGDSEGIPKVFNIKYLL